MAALTTLVGGTELSRDTDSWDDAQCVVAAQCGDPSGFALLYGRHRPGLLGRARGKWRLAGDVAEDVVHDAWVRALEHVQTFDTTRPFEPWLFRILDNVAIDHLRRTRTADGQSRHTASGPELLEVVEDGRTRDDERLADREVLTRAMAALPARQKQTAVGVLVSGLTLDEAAQELQLSNSACRQLLHRARLSLRRSLLEYGALPVLLPPMPGLRRRLAALARRLGASDGTALAGSGSTMVAVMLTVTVAVAAVDVANARPIEAPRDASTLQTVETTDAAQKRDARRTRARHDDAASPARARKAPASRTAPDPSEALVAIPAASVPTGHGVHQRRPENPDYNYSVRVKTPVAEARVGVVAEKRGATAPLHEAACGAADDLPQSHCEESARP
jgi:RNA polymerase sigma-70 factor (ECF subfamily)